MLKRHKHKQHKLSFWLSTGRLSNVAKTLKRCVLDMFLLGGSLITQRLSNKIENVSHNKGTDMYIYF